MGVYQYEKGSTNIVRSLIAKKEAILLIFCTLICVTMMENQNAAEDLKWLQAWKNKRKCVTTSC